GNSRKSRKCRNFRNSWLPKFTGNFFSNSREFQWKFKFKLKFQPKCCPGSPTGDSPTFIEFPAPKSAKFAKFAKFSTKFATTSVPMGANDSNPGSNDPKAAAKF